ncbi:FtsW/RodA/SpoVE family cell cycle protein [Paenibacillus silvae]|uniref:FtsW/RodA/SpoVE family cell cycle protein n=1 Tax=Paenibacillus silvae TaxID=1325358 RepID=UPI0025A007B9|nr:FtsW/RodA/SpoVE family cell cycle protein [Paenibacillus silvae]MDM5278055.1 FtsW/RodA/SpoVE family cell cycle protein [Paenibacillus silvae]
MKLKAEREEIELKGQKEHKEAQEQKVRNEKVDIYLDQICGQVKAREVHNDLREELGNHLHEIICDKEQEGYSPEQAAAYAIEQMGDPTELGKSMHKLHRHRMHWGLLVGIIGLAMVGVILTFIYTITSPDAPKQYSASHLIYTGLGVMAMLFCTFFDYLKWIRFAWWIYISINVLLYINPMLSESYGSMNRFLHLPFGIALDVTTLAISILPLAIGGIMSDRLRVGLSLQSICIYAALVVLPMVLLYQISDWVRLSLFACVAVLLFGWMTKKWWYTVITGFSCGVAAVLLLLVTDKYSRWERLSIVFHLDKDPRGNGFTYNSIIDIVKTAGWWGNGLGTPMDSLFKYFYLRFPGVMLVDMFGWSACVLLIVGVVWLIRTMTKMLPRINDTFGAVIAVSVTVTLALQMLYSLAAMTGRVPILSISFPLLGYGSHVILEYAMVGLLLGVYRRKDTVPISGNRNRTRIQGRA